MILSTEHSFSNDWELIADVISNGSRFLLTTHVNADPDALGSEFALAEALRVMRKEPLILNPTASSGNHAFLDPNHETKVYTHPADFEAESPDAVFILDISRWERLGALADTIREFNKPKICIDHHPYTGGFADYHLVNTKACASAEIVYDLICYLGVPLNKRIAECLYASVLSDTGSFTFSNTNARSHRIVAHLMQHDINAREIFERLYQNHTPERLRFMGKILADLQFDCESKLAWTAITHKMLLEHGLHPEDVEGFVDLPRNCRDVVLSILFLEMAPDDIKISLRAKGNFNANKLAGIFGGGGHNHASGIRMFGPLETVKQTILEEARRAMRDYLKAELTAKTS